MSNFTDFKSAGPIDLPSVLERIGGDEAFLQELIDIYIEDFIEKYGQLKQAIEQGEFDTIKEVGHSLKGASGNLSLAGLQETAYSLELSGKEKNIEEARNSFVLLGEEFERLKDLVSPEKWSNIEGRILQIKTNVQS
jgi:HPt (histidine-containing phosphotransfer) domain-containing protein